MRFEGRVLFVTGGGSGLGAATARRFASEGGSVAVVDLDGDRARALAGELDRAVGFDVNVSDEDSVRTALAETRERFGPVDAVFNSAGHADFGPIEEWALERWNRMMAVHVGGTFLVCKHVLPQMAEKGGGSIVNVASVCALVTQHWNVPYGAAKGAIISFTRQLAADCAPSIRVNVVAPGRVRTGMTEPILQERGADRFGAANLQQRVAEPEELAAPVCFLLSDEASFMTGSVVVVDGGETIA